MVCNLYCKLMRIDTFLYREKNIPGHDPGLNKSLSWKEWTTTLCSRANSFPRIKIRRSVIRKMLMGRKIDQFYYSLTSDWTNDKLFLRFQFSSISLFCIFTFWYLCKNFSVSWIIKSANHLPISEYLSDCSFR